MELSYVHPLAYQMRKNFLKYLTELKKMNQEVNKIVKASIVPESTVKQLEYQKRKEEKQKRITETKL